MQNEINFYFGGGTGMNRGKKYAKFAGQIRAGFATINAIFVDTSESNLDESVPADSFFHIENANRDEKLDGSGKNRKKNMEAIEAAVGPILLEFPPAKFNVFCGSLGGGSGSNICPLLMAEVMERGYNAIAVVVGNTGSGREVTNTKDSLMGFEGLAQELDKPVNVFYRSNTGRTRADVDRELDTFMMGLLVMFSGQNRELDTEDYVNFLNYDRLTKQDAQLGYIDLFSQTVTVEKGQSLLSLLTVVDNEEDSTESNIPVDYQAVGFINPAARNTFKVAAPVHMGIISNHFVSIINDLKKMEKGLDENRNLNPIKSIGDTSGGSTRTKRGLYVS